MINKSLKDISKTDLDWLIENKFSEDKTTEFKSELSLNDNGKNKILREIVGFANADGGDLIFGIHEENGVAFKIVPVIKRSEFDSMRLKLNDYLLRFVSPRINGLDIQEIDLGNDDLALVIRVRSSIFSPHAVYDGSKHNFFIRKHNSVAHMDVDELRNSFLSSDSFSRRIREFISERIVEIDANKYNYVNKKNPIITVHAIPINRFLKRDFFSINQIDTAVEASKSSAFHSTVNRRITFDGVRLISSRRKDGDQAYAHYFLDGTVEIAGQVGIFFVQGKNGSPQEGTLMIRSRIFCRRIIEAFQEIRAYYSHLQVDQPIVFFMSVLNARGYHIYNGDWCDYSENSSNIIDRDVVMLPETIVDRFTKLQISEIPNAIKPLLDSFWNSSGFEKCNFFDDEGNYREPNGFY